MKLGGIFHFPTMRGLLGPSDSSDSGKNLLELSSQRIVFNNIIEMKEDIST